MLHAGQGRGLPMCVRCGAWAPARGCCPGGLGRAGAGHAGQAAGPAHLLPSWGSLAGSAAMQPQGRGPKGKPAQNGQPVRACRGPHSAREAAKPGAGAPVAHFFGCNPLTARLGGCFRLAPVMLSFAVSGDVQSPVSDGACTQAADHVTDVRRFEMFQGPSLPGHSALLTHPGSPSSVTDDWRPAKRHSRPQKYVSLSPLS